MLNNNIANKFKMSPDPRLICWNLTMSIQDILNQLELAYGRLSGHKLLHNDTFLRSPFLATKAPERPFWHIKQCQEIQVIADNPYTPMQLMINAVQLLMVSGIFLMREFEDWEAIPNKMYNSLKLFVHGVYVHQLVAIQLRTTGQQGYVANQHNHNMYNVLEDGTLVTDDDGSVATITQQTAANITTGSTLGNTYAASLPTANPSPSPNECAAVAAAINQLSTNQTAMWSHMQNLLLHNSAPPTHVANPAVVYNPPHTVAAYQQHQVPAPVYAPAIQALNIPAPFHSGCFSQGRGGHGNGGHTQRGTGRGGRGPNPFGNVGRGAGTVFVPGGVVRPPYSPYPLTVAPAAAPRNYTPTPVKKFNN